VIKGSKPLAVLIRAMHYYEDQANGYMGLIAAQKPPPEPPKENVEDHKKWEAKIEALDLKATETAKNLRAAFDAAADYAFKAAGYVHARPSPDHGAQFDYTRLTADELRIFIPLFRKCLVNRATRQDSEQGGEGGAGPVAGGDGEASPATQH
jgi:hypothetical protein